MKCDTPMTLKEVKEMLGIVDRQPIPMTNEEYLRSCTTEQLAEFVIKAMILYDNSEMTVLEAIKNAMKNDVKLSNYFMESLLEWLKQPHTL